MPRQSGEGSPEVNQGIQEAERAAYCSVCEQLGYRSKHNIVTTKQKLIFKAVVTTLGKNTREGTY